ncbi:hypothetical protein B4589_011855 [Halolamina sp. CBA1230]|uniref:laminin B domain-containing protein n=1 Tax=Halolamina sp. CBA1230 TaxID=1853690 RepID=UPI0009A1D9E8|nr:laminin B domain-containing protein [Halolamina sp. CBA1230]QKY21036.1 hypothetical protein B4589_011855 [Halolamina sp. CBA1230]
MSDRNNRYRLSRRTVLAGLGGAGIASASAGLGTSAYLNDTESFEDNTITAGTLDLLVGYYSYWDQGMAGSGSVQGSKDGSGTVSAELGDVKPGDSGLLAFCPVVETNPAYLWLCGEITENSENGYTEPEPETSENGDVNDPGDPEGAGELAESISVTVNYCDVGEVGDSFDPEDVSTLAEVWSGSLADLMSSTQNGVPLDGDGEPASDGGFDVPGEQACFAGTGAAEASNPCLCLDWEVPTSVGNEIQGDSLEFDLAFHAEQCRNNDGTHNPCTGEEEVPDAVSISATPDTAGATDSIHRVEVPVGSGLGGDSLSSFAVDYPGDFDVGGVGTGDVLGAGVERADSSIDAVTVTGTTASDSDTAIQFSLAGGVTVATGDTIFVEYRDATNASSADDYSVVVDVNGGEIGPGTLTLVPPSSTPGPVSSTFDEDDDGWKITGDAQGGASVPDYEPSAGNPAPSISATDDVQGGTWYFEAPGKFLGGKSGFYGGTLSFDLMQEFSGSPSQFDNDDITLSGGGLTLTYDTAQNPGNGTSGNWTSYNVTLDESDNWMVSGSAATQTEIETVLADLTELRIRGEYRSGSDKGYLDNVSMQP